MAETFQTIISNGKTVELCEEGAKKAVTLKNYEEYIDLVVKTRLNEASKQMEWVKEGIDAVIDLKLFSMLTYEDVIRRACGMDEITVEAFKKITVPKDESKTVKMFWEMFENFSQEERQLYLKYVWGRNNLPSDLSNC